MIRVFVICEGQTEETFVKELLQREFLSKSIDLCPVLIGKPGHKGGNVNFDRLVFDIKNLLMDKKAYCTTFIDYYGLPREFPGKQNGEKNKDVEGKHKAVIDALSIAIEKKLNNTARRFIPYVQMYEFEALLFSEPEAFASGIWRKQLIGHFKKIRNNFQTPEMINDDPNTAPSKRIQALVDDYQKPLMGPLAALEIGLSKMREECKLFDTWLQKIEDLARNLEQD